MDAITIEGLTKRYPGFVLDQVSFRVPSGSIMGFIGENGAGKTTSIKAILGLIARDGGTVNLLGDTSPRPAPETLDQLGVVFDGCCFHDMFSARDVERVLRRLYRRWDDARYDALLRQFSLEADKPIKQYSRGMKTKLSIAAALSHGARLLILDEALDGLDPVARDEMLEVFQRFVEDERNTILLSLHNTTELARICDFITYLHAGKVVFSLPAYVPLEQYGVLHLSEQAARRIDPALVLGARRQHYGCELLVSDRARAAEQCPDAAAEPPALDQIMLLYGKELN